LDEQNVVYGVSFKAPFAEQTAFAIELPAGLKDEAERPLANADKFPLSIRTDRYPPLAKFPARFGIVELKGDRLLPVTLRNVEPEVKAKSLKLGKEEGMMARIIARIRNVPLERPADLQAALRRAASASREPSMLTGDQEIKEFKVTKPSGSRAFEVVGIPFEDPGLYLVELESTLLGQALLGDPKPMYVPTAVLVTNLSVHFKWGRESSLVWVTSLGKGEPVGNAVVTVMDCRETVLWTGKTDGDGMAVIHERLPSQADLPTCRYQPDSRDYPQMGALTGLQQGLFVVVQTVGDLSFVHSSWGNGIEPFRFKLPSDRYPQGVMAHTVFDRTLLRAGDTIHMKHVLRRHTMSGFSLAPSAQEPDTLSISHLGSSQTYESPLKWDANGIAETEWAIPGEARLGTYGVSLVRKEGSTGQRFPAIFHEEDSELYGAEMPGAGSSGTFRVEEFRVPLMKAFIKPPGEPLVNPHKVALDLGVQYLSGGGAGELPVKVRSGVQPRLLPAFEDFDGFVFANGRVREGIQERGREWEEEGAAPEPTGGGLKSIELVLDASGSSRVLIPDLPRIDSPRELLAEMEYRDPNGEVQTASSRIPLWNSKILIGIRPDSWAASQESFKFHVAVLDIAGKPIPGASVKVDLLQRKHYSHRKRLVGGFYSYEHFQEVKRVGTIFEDKTDSRGLMICEVRSPVSGNVILQAESVDGAGNVASAFREVWIADKGRWWFDISDHDRMDLIPEKKRYEPGETALLQARMPFKEATALITIEREGVMESWVRTISGEKAVIEVPVRGSYAPNVFVSALVVRGRVADVQPTALADLGKPSFKLGIAELMVGWKEHELKVKVSPDRSIYKVREKARVKIRARTTDDKAPPIGSEVAVAALDEGLLELMPNKSWDILPAMMGRRGYEVQTATAQMQVIGKRHYGLKALPSGGGGGRQITRELFDTLLLWKGRVALDANGEADVEIPLNDSITGFRIAAVATGGQGLFGTGAASIQSTQDLMIFSGLPPLVREGDRFRAEFAIRNTMQKSVEVEALAKAEGLSDALSPLIVSLAAGEAKTIGWEVRVPTGLSTVNWEVEVGEKGSAKRDRVRVFQKVIPAVPVRTFQATIAQVDREAQLEVEKPEDALPERGGVRVVLRPRLAESLSGVTEYMMSYPYGCMEQKISVAVSLRDEDLWKRLVAQLPSHMDSDGLVKYFPSMTFGSPALTSYIVAISHEAGWMVPEGLREKMERGLRGFVEGTI
ncbi:MAG: alpha-2-macroglobulin family protein, partial [Deltaproteobacteria bacterium]